MRQQKGFSLLELAIGLVIVATLLSALLVPLATQMDQRRVSDTQELLEQARDALIGFAIAQGRLPCPAAAPSSVAATEKGREVFKDQNLGECRVFNGWLPAVTLGLVPIDSDGYQPDAFGGAQNRIRYAVARAVATSDPTSTLKNHFLLTSVLGMNKALSDLKTASTPNAVLGGTNFLSICSTNSPSCTDETKLANGSAVAVIYSVGRNGAGILRPQSADENANLDDDSLFVSRVQSEQSGNPFDDLVLWVSVNSLINRLAMAGKL